MPGRTRRPRLDHPLLARCHARGITRARLAAALGIGRGALQDRLSGRRGRRASTWRYSDVVAVGRLLGVADSDAWALLHGLDPTTLPGRRDRHVAPEESAVEADPRESDH